LVRLACTKCDRKGQYRKATLLERYGPDANLVALRIERAAGCPKIAANKIISRKAHHGHAGADPHRAGSSFARRGSMPRSAWYEGNCLTVVANRDS
jgi:hypothetical protein